MAIRKCKMCAREFDNQNASVAFCSLCGSKQTAPVIVNDAVLSMYNKADTLRANGEFDKAAGIYELISSENPADAESYWSLVLCKFGVTYVQDLSGDRYVLRVGRMQNISVIDDENYKKALFYSDEAQKAEYQREAAEILGIQKNYFSKAKNQVKNNAPFASGRSSASVGGTNKGGYSVPQNNGSFSDINAGINNSQMSVDNLTKRMMLFIEDGKWNNAAAYCERILDADPENSDAYLGKLLIDLKVRTKENLRNLSAPFNNRDSFRRCMRFADEKLRNELNEINDFIVRRNTLQYNESRYMAADENFRKAATEEQFSELAASFAALGDYKDSAEKAQRCKEAAEVCRNEKIYRNAKQLFEKVDNTYIAEALQEFRKIEGWKDADEYINTCESILSEAKNAEKEQELSTKKSLRIVKYLILASAGAACLATAVYSAVVLIFALT